MSRIRIVRATVFATSLSAAMLLSIFPLQAQAAEPEIENLYREGLYLRETGKLYSALEVLESVLKSQPTLQRVRLELAVTYYRTLNFARAKAEAQNVLDDPKTPENVRLAILTFLAQVKKDEEDFYREQHRIEPFVSLGLVHDSNVNAGPDSAILPGGLVLTPGATSRGDAGYVLQAGVGHTYLSHTPIRIAESTARFMWKSQGAVYHRGYFDENDYDLTVATVATGPAWMVENKWRANVSLQLDNVWLGGREVAQYHSAIPSFTWQTRSGELTVDGLYSRRDFSRVVDQGRDSEFLSGGVSYGHLFDNGRIAGQVGLHVFKEDADASRHSNDGHEWFISGNFVAWANGNVFARYARRQAQHDGVEPVFGVARDETEHRFEIGLGHKFVGSVLKGWSLSGSWLRIENQANVPIYDYKRDLVTVTLNRAFN